MKDFTLKAYKEYLSIIKDKTDFYTFNDFIISKVKPDTFCLVRHDVDRKPKSALDMARLEKDLGIKSTYYFRIKDCSFNPIIIEEISNLGHEIGYHYECLSDSDGNYSLAFELFKNGLNKIRKIAPVSTISMHGRPFSKFDNRNLWKKNSYYEILKNDLNIEGEIYLEIDYKHIGYINDTGRNWKENKNNLRDKVNSEISTSFSSRKELVNYLRSNQKLKIVFQIHPERWSTSAFHWYNQLILDNSINLLKNITLFYRKWS